MILKRRNMKMPYLLADKFSGSAMLSKKDLAIVNNLRFGSRAKNFMLIKVEHEKSYITSGQVCLSE